MSVTISILILVIFLGYTLGVSNLKNCKDELRANHICKNFDNYDATQLPETNSGFVLLNSSIVIYDITDVNEIDQSVSLYFKITFFWFDLGLNTSIKDGTNQRAIVNIDKSLADGIWHPQIIFSKAQDIVKNKGYGYDDFFQLQIWGVHSKFMLKSEIISARFPCHFEFHSYPFDKQVCTILFTELRYDEFNFHVGLNKINFIEYGEHKIESENETISLNASRFPFKINISLSPAHIKMLGSSKRFKNKASLILVLERDTLQLLMGSFYIPTEIFGILSIGSYVINPEVVPGRMGLLVTTYLIAWNVYGSIDAPPSRGFSMVEVWITGVQCNILMAILEYLFVLALLRRETKSRKLQRVTKGIDFTFFICSIFYFTIFNLLYWTSMYTHD